MFACCSASSALIIRLFFCIENQTKIHITELQLSGFSVNTARHLHLSAYIEDTYPATHFPLLLWQTSMPNDTTLSYSPTVVALPMLQLSVQRWWRATAGGASQSEIGGALSHAICRLCLCSDLADMGLLHCRLVTRQTGVEQLHNFSKAPHYRYMLGSKEYDVANNSSTAAKWWLCITFACKYHLSIVRYRTWYCWIPLSQILDTWYRYRPSPIK